MNKTIEEFSTKASAVAASVHRVKTLDQAFDYVIDLCESKDACALLASGCELGLSEKVKATCDGKQQKVIAAMDLAPGNFKSLQKMGETKGFMVIDKGLREHLAGIDIGLTMCQGGIAQTGTLVMNSNCEDTRLATMISEIHVALVRESDIADKIYDQEGLLSELMAANPSYTAFITGPSRTADIERVLALGVHGPLELHILILKG